MKLIYIFETLEKLVSDFIDDVNELRGEL